ncbi:hypothetical protein KQI84_08605 [bacterium]|nr:hypothetical protein [bacterium]
MSKSSENTHNLVIPSIESIYFGDSHSVPTVICYDGAEGTPCIGRAAWAKRARGAMVNTDFKVDVGRHSADQKNPRKFPTAGSDAKTKLQMAQDYFRALFDGASNDLPNLEERSIGIMVSEPICIEGETVSRAWVQQYRSNIRSYLTEIGFSNIWFLPEPFAVYQYYRHGQRHPLLVGRKQTCALVLDLGGGTFDACIIITTGQGDVSKNLRMADAASAGSIPVGGFDLNRRLAKKLLTKLVSTEKKVNQQELTSAFRAYRKWAAYQIGDDEVTPRQRDFFVNFNRLVYSLEEPKIRLSNSIQKWGLNLALTGSELVEIPEDPFNLNSPMIQLRLTTSEFQEVFICEWNEYLKALVVQTIARHARQNDSRPIDIVLLSGGGANIGWLRELLHRDIDGLAEEVPIVTVEDYQQVVAHGLAIECTRRYYDENRVGDFRSVTYNRLCLRLSGDDYEEPLHKFKSVTADFPSSLEPGVVLPSAMAMEKHINLPLRWKVKLDHKPRRRLDYVFVIDSETKPDTACPQNFEERFVQLPKNVSCDSKLGLELRVGHDCCGQAKFILQHETDNCEEVSISARPFPIEMTDASVEEVAVEAYLGLDFGTSNSSMSFVDHARIEYFEAKLDDQSYVDTASLMYELPMVLSEPLRGYVYQRSKSDGVRAAREFLESSFMMCYSIIYMELCTKASQTESKWFKKFHEASIGKLWDLLVKISSTIDDSFEFAGPLRDLFHGERMARIDHLVKLINAEKHDKQSAAGIDASYQVRLVGSAMASVFRRFSLGHFESVTGERLSGCFSGYFRVFKGLGGVTKEYSYRGPESQYDGRLCLVSISKGRILPLEPLLIFGDGGLNSQESTIWMLDRQVKKREAEYPDGYFSFRAPTLKREWKCTPVENSAVFSFLSGMRDCDPNLAAVGGGVFEERGM